MIEHKASRWDLLKYNLQNVEIIYLILHELFTTKIYVSSTLPVHKTTENKFKK